LQNTRTAPAAIEETFMRHHPRQVTVGVALALAVSIGIAGRACAGIGCCAHCGQSDGCQKVCRLVFEEKKITTTCWGCKCEDFCAPGPSKPGCQHCEMVCDEGSDPKAPCVQPKRLVWTEWIPGCGAKIYTKKKLMKRTITRSVPSYKWVVEDLCPECEAGCEVVDIPAGADVPPAPTVDAKLKSGRMAPAALPIDDTKR
jgi:hypothetical protein